MTGDIEGVVKTALVVLVVIGVLIGAAVVGIAWGITAVLS